jgi:hypothetical protein
MYKTGSSAATLLILAEIFPEVGATKFKVVLVYVVELVIAWLAITFVPSNA